MIVRREFLKQTGLGTMASALVASGHLPLLYGGMEDPKKSLYPIQMIRPWVRGAFRPAESANLDWKKSLSLQYKLVNWLHRPPRRNPKAKRLPEFGVVGSLRIKRTPGPERTVFGLVQEAAAVNYPRRRLSGRFETGTDPDSPLEKWNVRVSTVPGKKPVLVESGARDAEADGYRVGHGKDRWTLQATSRPLISRFAMPFWFALTRPKRDATRRFDLLDDLTAVKPDQTLRFDRSFEIPVAEGKTVSLDGWVQTGQAVLPIHYLVDKHGLVQLATEGICCWALETVLLGA